MEAEDRVSGLQDKGDDLYQVNPEYEKNNKEKEHTDSVGHHEKKTQMFEF